MPGLGSSSAPSTIVAMIVTAYVSNRSAAMPAQSPTLSPTLSAITAGLRGSSSGMPASTLPTRSAPTSAPLVKMPPPRRAKIEISDEPNARPMSGFTTSLMRSPWLPLPCRNMKKPVTESRPRPTTSMPVMAPPLNAMPSAGPMPWRAASAVRTLERTDTFMPMKPAAPEAMAPIAKPHAVTQPSWPMKPMMKNSTRPTIAIVVYCLLRYALAPVCTAAAISRMRALPSGWRRIHIAVTPPYTSARTPATSARTIAVFMTMVLLPVIVECGTAFLLRLVFRTRLLRDGKVLQAHVLRQPRLVRRIRFPGDERRQVLAAFVGDVETVASDEVARHLLLDVGDIRELRHADLPAVWLARGALDGGHDAVHSLQREFHRGTAHRIGLVEVGLRGDVARGTLQVIGHRPVLLELELRLHEVRQHGRHAAQLRVPERVLEARLREELALLVLDAFGG